MVKKCVYDRIYTSELMQPVGGPLPELSGGDSNNCADTADELLKRRPGAGPPCWEGRRLRSALLRSRELGHDQPREQEHSVGEQDDEQERDQHRHQDDGHILYDVGHLHSCDVAIDQQA